MKAFLHSIRKTLTAAGVQLKSAWRVGRQQAAKLWQLVCQKAVLAWRTVKNGARRFWQQHQQTLIWLVVWLLFGTLATLGLLYAYHTHPQARAWLNSTAAATLALLAAPLRWLARQKSRSQTPAPPPTTAQTAQPIPGMPQPNAGSQSLPSDA